MSKVSLILGGLIFSYHSLSLTSSFLEKLQSEELPRPGGVWKGGIQHSCSLGQQGGKAHHRAGCLSLGRAVQSLGHGCMLSLL